MGDHPRLGLGEDVVRRDGVADEFADVGLAESGVGCEVGESGGGADGECVGEAELRDGFGAGGGGGLVSVRHDVLARAEEEVAEFEAVIDDGLAGEDDSGGVSGGRSCCGASASNDGPGRLWEEKCSLTLAVFSAIRAESCVMVEVNILVFWYRYPYLLVVCRVGVGNATSDATKGWGLPIYNNSTMQDA